MIITPATNETLSLYTDLCQRYKFGAEGSEENGFLVGHSFEENSKILAQGTILLAIDNGSVVGGVSGYKKDTPLHEAMIASTGEIQWDNEDLFASENLVYVSGIIVLPEARKSGTTEKLLNAFYNYYPNSIFWLAIVEAPVCNHRSAFAMKRHGFKRIGQFNSQECFGFKNYQSGLYVKRASHNHSILL
jgi:hypothetical protein